MDPSLIKSTPMYKCYAEGLEQINTTGTLQDLNVNQQHSTLVKQKIKTESETYTSNNPNKETIVVGNYTDKSNFCSNPIVNLEDQFQDINVIKQGLSIKVESDEITEIEENVDFEKKESSPLNYFDQENVNSVTKYPILLTKNDNIHSENVEIKHAPENTLVSIGIQESTPTDNTKSFNCEYCPFSCTSENGLRQHLHVPIKPKIFHCEVCDYVSTRKSHMNSHITIHTGDKRYKCQQCDYKSSQNSHLQRHLRIHTGEKPFQCDKCDFKSTTKGNLKNHYLVHTGEKPFECDQCDYRCTMKERLKKHLALHMGEKSLQCNYCDYVCSNKFILKKHIKVHVGDKPFSCEYCDYKCSRNRLLRTHIVKNHADEKLYRCGYCDYKASFKIFLERHVKMHTAKKLFQCGHCDLKFLRKSHLVRHNQIHIEEKPYQCELCNYQCAEEPQLKAHLSTHLDKEQNLNQSNANKFFKRNLNFYPDENYKNSLTYSNNKTNDLVLVKEETHEEMFDEGVISMPDAASIADDAPSIKLEDKSGILSNNQTPSSTNKNNVTEIIFLNKSESVRKVGRTEKLVYYCEYCDYNTTNSHRLERHIKTHTGEKPFECDQCDFKCIRRASLKQHMYTHTGEKPFKCDYCEFKTANKCTLIRHTRIHTGEKPFQCKHCDYKCSRSNLLKMHVSSKHAEEQGNQKNVHENCLDIKHEQTEDDDDISSL